MASTDAKPFPIKNTAYRITFPILDADGDLVTGAASLDSEISKDGGTFTDCTNEATQIATSSGMYYLDLSSDEMNADTVAIIVKTSTSGAKTTPIVLYPVENTDIPVNVKAISDDVTAPDNLELMYDGTGYAGGTIKLEADIVKLLGTAWLTPGVAGTPDVNAKLLGGTAQTGRDIGANVLLSPGSETGQLDFTSGVVKSNLAQILGTALTETGGYIAAAFKKLFNVQTPTLVASDVMRGTDSANTTVPDAAGVAATPAEVATALSNIKLDHLIAVADGDDPVNNSIIAQLAATDGDWSNFAKATDALQSIRDAAALEATLTAIKGSGWSDETLKAIKAAVDAISLAGIVDGVWDELQSGHTDAGSFGQYLDAKVSDTDVIGAGALSCTWTQKDDGGNPLDNCQVWITTDEAGSNVVAGALLTDSSGEVTFMLDAGTYYVWREKGGYDFTNPQSWVVS